MAYYSLRKQLNYTHRRFNKVSLNIYYNNYCLYLKILLNPNLAIIVIIKIQKGVYMMGIRTRTMAMCIN